MNMKELLDQLRLLGVSLGLNNGKLKLVDPQKKMTPELMQGLKQNKDAIVELMTKGKRFTQADFPFSKLSNPALADLQKHYPHMQKVMVATPMQQGMLFHSILDSAAYISNIYCQFEGTLDLPLFKQAWQTMIDRHEIYRTCFTGFEQEYIHQLVLSRASLQFEFQNWSELNDTEQDEAIETFHVQDLKTAFNLEAAPLFRLALFKLDEHKFHFSWTRHHAISDAWCSSIVFAEVIEIYQALLQDRTPRLQAAASLDGYVQWLERQDRQKATEYWKQQLSDVAHTTTFGIENYQPREQEVEHRESCLSISGASLDKLVALAKQQQTTMNVIVQSAWSYLLHLYSGEETVVVGSTISGRPPELPDIERMLGIFINTVPVVSRFSAELTIEELLSSLHQANLHANDYGYLSLSDVQKCSGVNEGGLFNNFINFNNSLVDEALSSEDSSASIGVRITDTGAHSQSNFDMSLVATFTDELTLRLLYNCNRFSKAQVSEIRQQFSNILHGLCKALASDPVASLNQMEESELKALISMGTGVNNPAGRDASIVNAISDIAALHPENHAIDDGSCALTHGQLEVKVRKLAAFLQEQGIEPGERVGVYFERTSEMLLATLAILKAGASYVMLEPRNSEQRLLHIVSDAGLELVLIQPSLMAKLPLKGIDVITIEEHMDDDWLAGYEQDFEPCYIELDSEAYVIYTSGSTGVPKGVCVPHQALVDYCAFAAGEYYHSELDGSLVITSHGFDISIPSLFLPLMQGGVVELLPWEEELTVAVEKFESCQKQYLVRVTPLHVAALLDLLPENFVTNLSHTFVIGGEQLTYELVARVQQHFPSSVFYNHYGPSETVVGCSLFHVTDFSGSGSVPIGCAMENTSLLVLDKSGYPVAQGMVGELHIAGICVANGYLNLPELTEEKFIENPFGQGLYSRMYKTGDLVRWLPQGVIEYVGRIDNQVKLRGFRVELDEIGNVLSQHQGVESAVVIEREQYLHAYLVADKKAAYPVRALSRMNEEQSWDGIERLSLDNGMLVGCLNAAETEFTYQEIFKEQTYLQHGIVLQEDACVFDIGANTGMVSLFVGQLCPRGRLFAFEPIPSVFKVLSFNAALYDLPIRLYECGISDRAQEASFTYYPNNSLISGRYGDSETDVEDVKRYLRQQHEEELLSGALTEAAFDELLAERLRSEDVRCALRPLSDIIGENDVEVIDLLKIDVQKSEQDVLAGIAEHDWSKIKQIVIEVHAIGKRIQEIETELRGRGFAVNVSRDEHGPHAVLYAVHESYSAKGVLLSKDNIGTTRYAWSDADVLKKVLRERLQAKLPEYMLPDTITLLDVIPLTANGKLDKRALPDVREVRECVSPRNDVEMRLYQVWCEVLKHDQIGVFDSFFDLGGHSILATRLISLIRKVFNCEIPLKTLFEQPTIAGLAKVVGDSNDEVNNQLPPLQASGQNPANVLSYAQKRLFFIDHLEKGSAQFNMSGLLSIRGELHKKAFESALKAITERHQVLRTSFKAVDSDATLHLNSDCKPDVCYRSLVEVAADDQYQCVLDIAREKSLIPFDLSRDKLFRVELLTLSENDYVAIFNMHHIASDGWSMGLLVKEFCSLYRAFRRGENSDLPELTVQYSDFAHWQQSLLASEVAQQQMDYWKSQLQGLPVVHSLPLDNPRTAKQDFSGSVELQTIPAEIVKKVDSLCQKQGVTKFMLLQTMFSLLLSRYGTSDDVVIGTPVAGRLHQNTEELIGCFINSLVLRTKVKENEPFNQFLERNKQMIVDAFDNQVTPFDLLVDELNPVRNLSHDPVFQIVFSLNNTESHDLLLDDLEVRQLQQPQTTSKSELEVSARELESGEMVIRWIYRDKLFNRQSINALMESYLALIENVLTDDTRASDTISLFPESKRAQLVNQGGGAFYPIPANQYFAEMVEEQVRLSPAVTAIKFREKSISYASLNTKANLLADYLLESGIEPGDRIGIYLERSPEVILAILAINKVGASYVALEPEHPVSRIEYIVQDSGVELVLTRSALLEKLKLNKVDVLMLDDSFIDDSWLIEFSAENPVLDDLPGEREMYLLYTSGTTGKPKGVEISNSGVANYLDYAKRHYLSADIQASVVSSPLCFDATVTSLLTPLTAGLAVHILDSEQDVLEQLTDYLLNSQDAYLFKFTPAHLNAISGVVEHTNQSDIRHLVVVGGEQFKQQTLQRWRQDILPNGTFVNEYGPTETVVGCSTFFATPEAEVNSENVSIGRAISNTQLYVLDHKQSILPALFQGELYIGGAGVALGYANKPELTSEKFVDNPFAPELSPKLYRTGDVVRWLADGTLEFLGRNDDQIKMNGYRIELAEIERQLSQSNEIKEAVVLKVSQPSEKLVAYVVHQSTDLCSDEVLQADCISKLQAHLRTELPNYMVPSQFIFIELVPLTTNAKVDVKALPLASEDNLNKGVFVAASNEVEKTLCSIWQELLSVDNIGIDDNYFALGGDSIISIQIVSRARKQELHFTVRDIFDNQTVRTLAQVVDTESQFEAQQEAVSGEMPLLPIQTRFAQSNIADKHHFNQSVLLRANRDVNAGRIAPLVAAIYQRHDVLRLRVKPDLKTGYFIPMSEALLKDSILFRDLSHLPSEHRESALTEGCNSIQKSFDLEGGSLFRVVLFDLGNGQKCLFVVAHHLIVDAVSWRILLRDFEFAYEQLISEKAIVLDKKTSSIQQWAEALKRFAGSDEIQGEKRYWLEQLPKPYAALKFDSRESSASGREVLTASLSESETRALLSEVSQVYRTEVNEFLLAALAIGIKNWTHQSIVRIELEGHGREELFETLDVTETVGWFTSLYPLILDISSSSDNGEVLKSVKEQYRTLPRHGIGYGLLKELQEDSELRALDDIDESQRIYFNYLGQFDSTLQQEGAFAPASEERGSSFSEKQSLQALANLTAAVSDAKFHFSIAFNPAHLPTAQANQFLNKYMEALRACLLHCSASDLSLSADPGVSNEEMEESSEEFLI